MNDQPGIPRTTQIEDENMKVAISGAGIAGPALAYWLHRNNHQPVLIEQAAEFRAGGYLVDFWGVGYTVAERMGILPEVCQAGYLVREVRMVDERGRKVGGFSTNVIRQLSGDRFTSLPRGDLAAIAYRAIEDRIETIFGDSISSLDEYETGVHVAFEHAAPRDFDLVVGADGLHSNVRRLAFGPESQFEKQLGYHVAAFGVQGYRPRDELAYICFTKPGLQVARFALRDDQTMFLFIFVDDQMNGPEPQEAAGRKTVLHRIFDDAGWECRQILQAMDLVDNIYFDRVSQIKMQRWSKGRVMLLGDAAACVSLLAGEGTGLALTGAYVLAGELERAGGDYRDAFGRHEERLRPFIEKKQRSAHKFASAFAPKTRFGVWFRDQMTKLLAIPPLARYFVGRDLRDDFELPEYTRERERP
jgi:2-polyprenyl-6-methoxyphenol hydroxylase-like FAD-dependent oxidoreductase